MRRESRATGRGDAGVGGRFHSHGCSRISTDFSDKPATFYSSSARPSSSNPSSKSRTRTRKSGRPRRWRSAALLPSLHSSRDYYVISAGMAAGGERCGASEPVWRTTSSFPIRTKQDGGQRDVLGRSFEIKQASAAGSRESPGEKRSVPGGKNRSLSCKRPKAAGFLQPVLGWPSRPRRSFSC